jgi:hypothetical protein
LLGGDPEIVQQCAGDSELGAQGFTAQDESFSIL